MPLPAKRLKTEPVDHRHDADVSEGMSRSPSPPAKKARESSKAAASSASAKTKIKASPKTKGKVTAKPKAPAPASPTQAAGRRWTAAEYETLFTRAAGRVPMKYWEGAVAGRTALQCDRAWNRRLLPKILKMIRESEGKE